jgi:hypothetical protein
MGGPRKVSGDNCSIDFPGHYRTVIFTKKAPYGAIRHIYGSGGVAAAGRETAGAGLKAPGRSDRAVIALGRATLRTPQARGH